MLLLILNIWFRLACLFTTFLGAYYAATTYGWEGFVIYSGIVCAMPCEK